MTGVHQILTGSSSLGTSYLMNAISSLGLTTSLNLVLDAGDTSSYSGTGQQWSDVSGNNNNYNRGSTSAVQAQDPTFVGSAGDPISAYWLFDGNEFFSPTATQTFADSWHKANAAFTVVGLVYLTDILVNNSLFSTKRQTATATAGILVNLSGSVNIVTSISNASLGTGYASSTLLVQDSWMFVSLGFTQGGTSDARVNTTSNTQTPGTNSTATTNVSKAYAIGASDAGTEFFFANGSRMKGLACWSRQLSVSETLSLYNAVGGRLV